MRMLLAALAISLLPLPSLAGDQLQELDWMATFIVANEKCPGQNFSKFGLLGHMARVGGAMGWGREKIEAETYRRYRQNLREYEVDRIAFCATAKVGRRQFGEPALKNMQVVY